VPPTPTPTAAAPAGGRSSYGKLPEGDDVEILEVSRMRRAIADNTILSKQMTPHFYITMDIDVEPLLRLRETLNTALEKEGIKISVNDMVVKATALALRQFPNLNTHYYGDKLVRHKHIHIGIAVALPNNGLMNVVARDADRTTLSVLAQHNKEMFARAREGKVKPEDIRGATFTVSNLGPYDVEHFGAIINPPEAGILAVSSARKVPVVLPDGTLGIGQRMKVTISVDHRVSDGAEGAEFMRYCRQLLEQPMRLLV
jgi:pyruvate dehydrogenase E2 component (dihydrolipoamide acetyltransferase)